MGSFYESLLREVLNEVKPASLEIGTGFVFDLERLQTSRQLDAVVYDCTKKAALFRNREFVVVSSDLLVSVAEIKKSLVLKDVRQQIQNTINFRFGTHGRSPNGVQFTNLFAYSSDCKTEAVAECVKDEVSDHVSNFHAQTASGAPVMIAALYITLPRIYFFDRAEFIETTIRRMSDGPEYTIEVSVLRSPGSEDGLNEFLSAMIPEEKVDLTPNLRSMPLREELYSIRVPKSLLLATKISLTDLAERLPNERNALQAPTIGGQKPYAAFVPSYVDWGKIHDLDGLQRMPGFSWATIPIRDTLDSSPQVG